MAVISQLPHAHPLQSVLREGREILGKLLSIERSSTLDELRDQYSEGDSDTLTPDQRVVLAAVDQDDACLALGVLHGAPGAAELLEGDPLRKTGETPRRFNHHLGFP